MVRYKCICCVSGWLLLGLAIMCAGRYVEALRITAGEVCAKAYIPESSYVTMSVGVSPSGPVSVPTTEMSPGKFVVGITDHKLGRDIYRWLRVTQEVYESVKVGDLITADKWYGDIVVSVVKG